MEIKNTVFQDLEKEDFQTGYGKFWILAWKSSKNILKYAEIGVA